MQAPPLVAAAAPTPDDVFAGGPLLRLRSRLWLLRGQPYVRRRALLFVLLTWLPLVVLSTVQGSEGRVFLRDIGSFARYVVAGPLLIASEVVCLAVLGSIARRLLDLMPAPESRPRYTALLGSVREVLRHPVAEAAVVVLAYLLSATVHQAAQLSHLPDWFRAADGTLSLAGWWHALVSLPLLLMLLLGWLWRLLMWTRFLWLVSRFDLALVPVHPDRAGGIGFVGDSLAGFAPVGAALGAIVAGSIANRVIYGGSSLTSEKYAVVTVVLVAIVLFSAPLVTFSGRLLATMRRGAARYDELATALGRQFEREWFDADHRAQQKEMLDRGDFSAATDLYQVVDRVHAMRLMPIQLKGLLVVALATALPFVPVTLAVVSFDAVIDALLGLLH
jgi:hypothetical protein